MAELKAVINTFDAPDGRKCDHKDFMGRISVTHATGFSLDHDITEGEEYKLGQNYLVRVKLKKATEEEYVLSEDRQQQKMRKNLTNGLVSFCSSCVLRIRRRKLCFD